MQILRIHELILPLSQCAHSSRLRQERPRHGSRQPLRFRITQYMIVSFALQIRPQRLGIDRVPPTMRALDNGINVGRIVMPMVFVPIQPNRFPDLILELRRNGVLRRIHVRYIRVGEALGKLFPSLHLYLVGFTNVETPNFTRRSLQYTQQMKYLFISHSFVEVLHLSERQSLENVSSLSK